MVLEWSFKILFSPKGINDPECFVNKTPKNATLFPGLLLSRRLTLKERSRGKKPWEWGCQEWVWAKLNNSRPSFTLWLFRRNVNLVFMSNNLPSHKFLKVEMRYNRTKHRLLLEPIKDNLFWFILLFYNSNKNSVWWRQKFLKIFRDDFFCFGFVLCKSGDKK